MKGLIVSSCALMAVHSLRLDNTDSCVCTPVVKPACCEDEPKSKKHKGLGSPAEQAVEKAIAKHDEKVSDEKNKKKVEKALKDVEHN